MSKRIGDADEIEATIAELLAQLAEVSRAVREYGEIGRQICDELAHLLPEREVAGAGAPLAPDVLEIATLQAQSMGISVEGYVREAVLDYARDGATPEQAGARAARQEAARLKAENHALTAQGAQAIARAEALHGEAVERRAEDAVAHPDRRAPSSHDPGPS
jgi:hypothetical protein